MDRFSVTQKKKVSVAFIAHPTDLNIFRNYIKKLCPDKSYNDKLLIKLFEWAPSYQVHKWDNICIDPQQVISGIFIMVPFIPEMKDIALKQVIGKIEGALSIAQQSGCSVASLGAFTSIIMQGREAELSQKYGMKITSGNTFTAALIVSSIESIVQKFQIDLRDVTLSIIGASGDIGSGCVAYFGRKVRKMILSARSISTLQMVTERLESCIKSDCEITSDNYKAIKMANIVILVTSSYSKLFSLADFNPGSIVCDASAPVNVSLDNGLRPDVFAYHGGIVKLPQKLQLDFDIGLASPYHFYGCQTEGLMIAANKDLPCSWGRGNITQPKLIQYIDAFQKNAMLELAYSIENIEYTTSQLDQYAKKIKLAAQFVSRK